MVFLRIKLILILWVTTDGNHTDVCSIKVELLSVARKEHEKVSKVIFFYIFFMLCDSM